MESDDVLEFKKKVAETRASLSFGPHDFRSEKIQSDADTGGAFPASIAAR